MPRIAVIGAGLSGLAAAYRLSSRGHEVRLFEKSRGLSGRAASRSRNGCRYDHGANYFKVRCNEVARLLFDELPTGELCRIVGDVWTFDRDGTVEPGDSGRDRGAKWTYRSGISTLGKLLVQVGDLDVRRETFVERIDHDEGAWRPRDDEGAELGEFDALLLTAPAPQAVELLGRSEIDPAVRDVAVSELERVSYHSQFSIAFNYAEPFSLPGDAFALVNTDRGHPVAWISNENRKAGHVPEGETILIVQMSPAWTRDHYHDEEPVLLEAADAALREVLSDPPPPRPHWADSQRWRFARPTSPARIEAMEPARDIGLFFAGDAFVGKGRVSRAIETGFDAARSVDEHFDRG